MIWMASWLRGGSSALRTGPLTLMTIATIPFSLVCCKGASSDTATPTPSASTAAESLPGSSASPSASTVAEVIDAAPSIASTASAVVPQSPKAKCEQARRDFSAVVVRSRACHEDADCTQIFTSCALPGVCGMPVAKDAVSKVKAAEKPFDQANCSLTLVAPCPTCAQPPPAKCVAGTCS